MNTASQPKSFDSSRFVLHSSTAADQVPQHDRKGGKRNGTCCRTLQVVGPFAWRTPRHCRQRCGSALKTGSAASASTSQILPLKTHTECGYEVHDLPDGQDIVRRFRQCGKFAKNRNIRTTFHPDQFVVLNSPRADVVDRSVDELEYQSEVAEWVGADVVNIHGGGAYGDKQSALDRFAQNLGRLSARARKRLTVENDDTTYTPSDLLPLCCAEGIPLVYDIHHHRCNPDGLSEEEVTENATATWNREPLFHISSPLEGWEGPKPARHHDFIDIGDFPECWQNLGLTVEVEAKAKEVAVLKLMKHLATDRSS